MSGKKYDYLDEERRKLWAEVTVLKQTQENVSSRLEELQEVLEKRTPEYEKDARHSSAQVTRYKNKSAQSAKEAEESATRVNELLTAAEGLTSKIEEVDTIYGSAIQQSKDFKLELEALLQKKSVVESNNTENPYRCQAYSHN